MGRALSTGSIVKAKQVTLLRSFFVSTLSLESQGKACSGWICSGVGGTDT